MIDQFRCRTRGPTMTFLTNLLPRPGAMFISGSSYSGRPLAGAASSPDQDVPSLGRFSLRRESGNIYSHGKIRSDSMTTSFSDCYCYPSIYLVHGWVSQHSWRLAPEQWMKCLSNVIFPGLRSAVVIQTTPLMIELSWQHFQRHQGPICSCGRANPRLNNLLNPRWQIPQELTMQYK